MGINEVLHRAYYDELIKTGLNVYASTSVPEIQTYPYIIINGVQLIQRRTKPCLQYEAFVTITVVTGNINPVGRLESMQIGEQVNELINADYGDIPLSEGYVCGSTYLQGSQLLESKQNNYYIYTNNLTFRHLINR
jgi:hypothetical protein